MCIFTGVFNGLELLDTDVCSNPNIYLPCLCSENDWVFCGNIPLGVNGGIFEKQVKLNNDEMPIINNIELIIPPTEQLIAADILSNRSVSGIINLKCQAIGTQMLRIEPAAFKSSSNFLKTFRVNYCDVTGLNFLFLANFQQLSHLALHSDANVGLAEWRTLPPLPKLSTLRIWRSTGMEKWESFPVLNRGLSSIILYENKMGNEAMDRILQWLVNDSKTVDTLNKLNIPENALTRVPKLLSAFKNLLSLDLSNNPLNGILRNGSFNLLSSATLFLDSSGITAIEPGAFSSELFNGIVSSIYVSNRLIFFRQFPRCSNLFEQQLSDPF